MKSNFIKGTYQSFRTYLDEIHNANKIYSDLIPLSIGYPIGKIVQLSDDVLDALSVKQNGSEIERIGYGWNFSTTRLKDYIASYENTKNGTGYSSENIALTAGGTHAVNKIVELLTIDKKNEIIVASPAFYRLFGLIQKYSNIIPVPGTPKKDFIPDYKSILESITPNTKIIFISNPSNPAYKFYPAEELSKIIKYAEANDIYILLDEVGDAFRFRNYSYPGNIESPVVIRVNSASKFLLLAEYSLGYVIARSEITSAISKIVSDELGHIPFAGCIGWLKGLELEQMRLKKKTDNTYNAVYEKNLSLLKSNRDYTVETLSECSKIKDIIVPDACFSLIFRIETNKYKDDISLFKDLLHKQKVSIVPGSGFGIPKSDMFFRLTFAIDKPILSEGLKRIVSFIESN